MSFFSATNPSRVCPVCLILLLWHILFFYHLMLYFTAFMCCHYVLSSFLWKRMLLEQCSINNRIWYTVYRSLAVARRFWNDFKSWLLWLLYKSLIISSLCSSATSAFMLSPRNGCSYFNVCSSQRKKIHPHRVSTVWTEEGIKLIMITHKLLKKCMNITWTMASDKRLSWIVVNFFNAVWMFIHGV